MKCLNEKFFRCIDISSNEIQDFVLQVEIFGELQDSIFFFFPTKFYVRQDGRQSNVRLQYLCFRSNCGSGINRDELLRIPTILWVRRHLHNAWGHSPEAFSSLRSPVQSQCSEMKRCISKWSISKYFPLHVSNIFVYMYEHERWFLFRCETIFSVVVAHGKTVYRISTCVDIYVCSYVRACVRVWVCCTFFRSMHPGSRFSQFVSRWCWT